MDVLVYLLCYFLEIKDKPGKNLIKNVPMCANINTTEQHGLCRALSYIIQTLSAEHAFGLQLTFPIKSAHIPAKWNVGGAAADFMINVRASLEFIELLVMTARTGYLLDYCHNIWLSQRDVSSTRHSTVQLGALFQIP